MAVYGNAGSLSGLLSAANSARKRQETLQDSIASYEWDLSAKTQEDYAKYAAHLSGRLKTYESSDPMRALEYQKQLTSAERSSVSAEIGRQTTQVLYGNSSNRDKYNTIAKFYERALSTGDANLAQRLESQAARLSVTIQNEEDARARAAEAAAGKAKSAAQKEINDSVQSIDRQHKQLDQNFKNGLITLDEYSTALGNPEKGVFAQKQAILSRAIDNPNVDPSVANSYVDKLNSMYDSADFKRFTGPALKQFAENRPYAVRVDPLTGERTIQKRDIVGAGTAKPGELNNIFSSGGVDLKKVKDGSPQFLDVTRNLTGAVGDPKENYQFQLFNSKAAGSPYANSLGGKEFNYYLDPITGEPIVYDPESNVPRAPLKTLEENMKKEDKSRENTDLSISNIIGDYAHAGKSILNTVGGALNGIISGARNQQEADRLRKAQEEADRQKQLEAARQQAVLQQLAVQKTLTPLPASAKATYSAGTGVKVAAPFSAPNAAAAASKATGSAEPVITTFVNGISNLYGRKW